MARWAVVALLVAVPAAAAPAPSVDVRALTAAIPAAWKGKLTFVAGAITSSDGRQHFALALPVGWKPAPTLHRMLEPGDKPAQGISKTFGMSSFSVKNDCNGMCEPKDWAAAVKRATSRLFVYQSSPAEIEIEWMQWTVGDDHFVNCDVRLDTPAFALVDVFKQMCEHVTAI